MKISNTLISLLVISLINLPQIISAQTSNHNPLDFKLLNESGQNIVYIDDVKASKGQLMNIVLDNIDKNPLEIAAPKGKLAQGGFQFMLTVYHDGFKYFSKESLEKITLSSSDTTLFDLSINLTADPNNAYFFLKYKAGKYEIAAGEKKSIGLVGFKGNGTNGPKDQVEVELMYQGAYYPSAPSDKFGSNATNYIDIKNAKGLENIPLHAGLLGNGSVLNYNKIPNTLSIGLENIVTSAAINKDRDTLYYDKNATTITISCQLEPNPTEKWLYPWSLMTKNQFANLTLNDSTFRTKGNTSTGDWNAKLSPDNKSWVLTAANSGGLGPGDVLQIDIGNIITSLPNGVSYIYVKYHHIIGYYDGYFSIPVTKSAIFEKNNKVSIGMLPLPSHVQTLQIEGGILARGGEPGGTGSNSNNNGYAFFRKENDKTGLFSPAVGEISLHTYGWKRLLMDQYEFSILGIGRQINTLFKIDREGAITTNNSITLGGDISSATGNITDIGTIKTRGEIKAGSDIQADGAIYARGGTPGPGDPNNNGFAFKGNNGDDDSGMFSKQDGELSLYVNASERIKIDSSFTIKDNDGKVLFNITNDGAITYVNDMPNSVTGYAENGNTVTAPKGTTRGDWSIIVSLNYGGGGKGPIGWFHCSANPKPKTDNAWLIDSQVCYSPCDGNGTSARAKYMLVRK